MTTVTVGTADLHHALSAVAPHATNDPELPTTSRVRLSSDGVNLTVTATNRYTVGHAIVSVDDDQPDPDLVVDLSLQDVKEITTLFKGKDDDDQTVRLDVDDRHLTCTDASGLFEGKSLRLPRLAIEENYPDLTVLVHRSLTAGSQGTFEKVVTNGKLVNLFNAAVKAYDKPLVIEATVSATTALLIGCGESFIGLLMPMRVDEDTTREQDEWREAWIRRLDRKALAMA
jgi:hypothetical protein